MLKSRAIARFTSFTLLPADSHALLHRCQQNGNEKRMPVILGEGVYAHGSVVVTANPIEKK